MAVLAPLIGAYAILYASPYELRVLTVAGVHALAALGFHLVFGLGGTLSLAQGAFFGVGAYATGILGAGAGLGFLASFPAALLAAAALALPLGMVLARLESHAFALATLGAAQILWVLAVNLPELTGGANGLAGVPGVALGIGADGWTVPRGLPLAGFVWGWVAVGVLLLSWLGRGRFGRMLRAQRDDPLAAGCLGIDVARVRLLAFVAGAAYAGAAGALAAHTQRVVSPEVMEMPVMVGLLAMVVVGGRERPAGALLGALLLIHLPEWFRGLERAYLLAYGAALLAAILLLPDGIAGALDRLRPPRRRLPAPLSLPPRRQAPGSGPVIEVEDLAKAYGGVQALAGVGFTPEAGRIAGLIGPNGSGKTTLLNLLSGLDRPDRGRLRIAGRAVSGARADRLARLGVARSFQTPLFAPEATVLETVAAARLTLDRSPAQAEAHALAVLEELGLAEVARERCVALPAGLRRRVDLARALARRPALLLLDEPAAGLTAAEQGLLAATLRAAAADGTAILLVEHDMDFLLPLVGRLLVLDRGRLLADGPPGAVTTDPAVLAAYLGTAPARSVP